MDQQEVADIMADHYFSVSSNNNYSLHFLAIKHREGNKHLNFHTNEYLKDFITKKEIDHALTQCNNSAPGLDLVYYEMLRHLADSA